MQRKPPRFDEWTCGECGYIELSAHDAVIVRCQFCGSKNVSRIGRSKYRAKRSVYNGRPYDSKFEAGVAAQLDMLLRAGEFREITPQKVFELRVNGKIVARHRVDFLCTMPDGSQKVIEAKGPVTETWRLKRELFIALHPHIPYEVWTDRRGARRRRRRRAA